MNHEDKPFEFSELVMLYCKNWKVIKTLEQRWKSESDELVDRVRDRLAEYEEEWNIYFSNTYGWAKKKAWKKADSGITYNYWFEPGRIGKGEIGVSIQVKDKELRKKVCEELGKKIEKTFGDKVSPRNEHIFTNATREIGDKNYDDAIVELVELCIDFSPNLDTYTNS